MHTAAQTKAPVQLDTSRAYYAIRQIDGNHLYICLLKHGIDYLCIFDSREDALDFARQQGAIEYTDTSLVTTDSVPFSHYYYRSELYAA